VKVTEDGLVETNYDEVIESFDDMGLKEDLLRGIYSYGFEKPSAIQQRAIKPLIMMRDTIAQAQSGTGKTATFTIGLLQNIDLSNRDCQALILAPTRELASQIVKVVMAIGDYLGVSTMACIGGTNVRQDMDKLRAGVQLVVGTPGRVFDMINRRALAVDYIHYFVLDEADEMLSRGFKDQIYDVFQKLPPSVHVGLFSATMPADVLELTSKFMRDPIRILVKRDELTLDGKRGWNTEACCCPLPPTVPATGRDGRAAVHTTKLTSRSLAPLMQVSNSSTSWLSVRSGSSTRFVICTRL